MTVPEAALDEYNDTPFRKDDVRLSGKIFSVKPEAESGIMQNTPDQQFGLRVFATNARHHFRTLYLTYGINQQLFSLLALGEWLIHLTSQSRVRGLQVPKLNSRTACKAGCPNRRPD